jgi:hypothetical protein
MDFVEGASLLTLSPGLATATFRLSTADSLVAEGLVSAKIGFDTVKMVALKRQAAEILIKFSPGIYELNVAVLFSFEN